MFRKKIIFCILLSFLGVFFLTSCATSPSSYFHSSATSNQACLKIAVIPLANLTSEKEVDKKATYILLTYLLNSKYFEVIEIGEVEKAIKDAKVVKDENLSFEKIKKIGQLTGADVLLVGAVEEYKIDSSTMLGEKVFVPEVSISLRLISANSGAIIWAANHHRRGDDRITMFGMGRIDSISKLTDIVIRDTIASLIETMQEKGDEIIMNKNNCPIAEAQEVKEEPAKSAPPVMNEPKETPPEAKQTVLPRQDIKDMYNKEYENIKKQY